MKLVGLVFLGLIASAVFYYPAFILVAIVLKVLGVMLGELALNNIGEIAGYLLAIFVVPPIAFFFGSIITGYFSYYDIQDKWMLIWMAPALYFNLLWMCVAGVRFALDAFIEVNPPGPGFVTGLLLSAAIGLLWYLASLAGVRLGYFLRERFAKWYYGD